MRKGFTLLELLMIVAIIGIFIAIGVPQYFRVVEKGRMAEALDILDTIRKSQISYYDDYKKYATDISVLDIELDSLKYFQITEGADDPKNPSYFAKATRNNTANSYNANYILTIKEDGNITCFDGEACANIGYLQE